MKRYCKTPQVLGLAARDVKTFEEYYMAYGCLSGGNISLCFTTPFSR